MFNLFLYIYILYSKYLHLVIQIFKYHRIGFVLKKDKVKAEKVVKISLEELIEKEVKLLNILYNN